jgi:hypothetical protein
VGLRIELMAAHHYLVVTHTNDFCRLQRSNDVHILYIDQPCPAYNEVACDDAFIFKDKVAVIDRRVNKFLGA